MTRELTDAEVRNAVGFVPSLTTQMRFSDAEAEKFDRWLARVKEEAATAAWDEGARWAYEELTGEPEGGHWLLPEENPYREQAK